MNNVEWGVIMEWLIVSLLVIACVIFFLMKKLDRILEQHKINPEHIQQGPSGKPYTLILGETPIADRLKSILESKKIDYIQIQDENVLDRSKHYNCLFAVSNDDLSNMLTCIIVNQIKGDCSTIAICNHLHDRKLYEQNNIPYLLAPETSADELFQIIDEA